MMSTAQASSAGNKTALPNANFYRISRADLDRINKMTEYIKFAQSKGVYTLDQAADVHKTITTLIRGVRALPNEVDRPTPVPPPVVNQKLFTPPPAPTATEEIVKDTEQQQQKTAQVDLTEQPKQPSDKQEKEKKMISIDNF